MSPSWFDEQMHNRIRHDEECFENAFVGLSSVVLGRSAISAALNDDQQRTRTAIEEILKFYGVKSSALPESIEDMNDQLDFLLRPAGIMRRVVKLQNQWWRDAIGPMLGQTANGNTVALIPSGYASYTYMDHQTGSRVKVNKKNRHLLQEEAFCFYKPFPLRALGIKDLLNYITGTISRADIAAVVVISLIISLLGLFLPEVTRIVFGNVLPSGKTGLLLPIFMLLLGVTVSNSLVSVTRTLLLTRVQSKITISAEAAIMSRMVALPAKFFQSYNAGELAARMGSMNRLCQMLCSAVLSTGLTALFSFVYILQIMSFTPSLAMPALLIIALQLILTVLTGVAQIRITRLQMDLMAKQQGLTFAVFSGIQKIKLAGAEKRIFARWADVYRKQARLAYDPPVILKIQPVMAGLVALGGTIVIYFSAAVSQVSIADYMAFNAAYGLVAGAIISLASVAMDLANIRPQMEMLAPLLEAVPEIGENKEIMTRLSGSIELNNVSFKYNDSMPWVLDNLSLKIRPGQYVAIVGQTGCGKSTLMRLLLGLETPNKGAIYYDGHDLAKLDLRAVRQSIGSVLQNGKLFSGDIFSNIVVTAPWLGLDDAWAAAELAGIAEDIQAMPMGMHTIISEGSGGISGGQRQRLMIARAIVAKPRILIFDEATSALDNITQRQVSHALDGLKSTRIVIAHRLSTIMHCDRIIVLDKGQIAEDGTYQELMEHGGYFAELVARQRLDDEAFVGKSTLF